jgi:hypothetical protein
MNPTPLQIAEMLRAGMSDTECERVLRILKRLTTDPPPEPVQVALPFVAKQQETACEVINSVVPIEDLANAKPGQQWRVAAHRIVTATRRSKLHKRTLRQARVAISHAFRSRNQWELVDLSKALEGGHFVITRIAP